MVKEKMFTQIIYYLSRLLVGNYSEEGVDAFDAILRIFREDDNRIQAVEIHKEIFNMNVSMGYVLKLHYEGENEPRRYRWLYMGARDTTKLCWMD